MMTLQEVFDDAAGGILIQRIVTDDDGNIVEQWPDPNVS